LNPALEKMFTQFQRKKSQLDGGQGKSFRAIVYSRAGEQIQGEEGNKVNYECCSETKLQKVWCHLN